MKKILAMLLAVAMLLSLAACAGIIVVFVVKGVSDYMYEKRYS